MRSANTIFLRSLFFFEDIFKNIMSASENEAPLEVPAGNSIAQLKYENTYYINFEN